MNILGNRLSDIQDRLKNYQTSSEEGHITEFVNSGIPDTFIGFFKRFMVCHETVVSFTESHERSQGIQDDKFSYSTIDKQFDKLRQPNEILALTLSGEVYTYYIPKDMMSYANHIDYILDYSAQTDIEKLMWFISSYDLVRNKYYNRQENSDIPSILSVEFNVSQTELFKNLGSHNRYPYIDDSKFKEICERRTQIAYELLNKMNTEEILNQVIKFRENHNLERKFIQISREISIIKGLMTSVSHLCMLADVYNDRLTNPFTTNELYSRFRCEKKIITLFGSCSIDDQTVKTLFMKFFNIYRNFELPKEKPSFEECAGPALVFELDGKDDGSLLWRVMANTVIQILIVRENVSADIPIYEIADSYSILRELAQISINKRCDLENGILTVNIDTEEMSGWRAYNQNTLSTQNRSRAFSGKLAEIVILKEMGIDVKGININMPRNVMEHDTAVLNALLCFSEIVKETDDQFIINDKTTYSKLKTFNTRPHSAGGFFYVSNENPVSDVYNNRSSRTVKAMLMNMSLQITCDGEDITHRVNDILFQSPMVFINTIKHILIGTLYEEYQLSKDQMMGIGYHSLDLTYIFRRLREEHDDCELNLDSVCKKFDETISLLEEKIINRMPDSRHVPALINAARQTLIQFVSGQSITYSFNTSDWSVKEKYLMVVDPMWDRYIKENTQFLVERLKSVDLKHPAMSGMFKEIARLFFPNSYDWDDNLISIQMFMSRTGLSESDAEEIFINHIVRDFSSTMMTNMSGTEIKLEEIENFPTFFQIRRILEMINNDFAGFIEIDIEIPAQTYSALVDEDMRSCLFLLKQYANTIQVIKDRFPKHYMTYINSLMMKIVVKDENSITSKVVDKFVDSLFESGIKSHAEIEAVIEMIKFIQEEFESIPEEDQLMLTMDTVMAFPCLG